MWSHPRRCRFAMRILDLPTAHIYWLRIITQMCCSTFALPRLHPADFIGGKRPYRHRADTVNGPREE